MASVAVRAVTELMAGADQETTFADWVTVSHEGWPVTVQLV